MHPIRVLLAIVLGTASMFSSTRTMHILSATVKDQNIAGAQIILQRNGSSSVSGITDALGMVTINVPYDADDDSVTVIVSKLGYSALVVKGPCNNFTYALSPVMTDLDGLRIVLSWAQAPGDLDAHLVYPGSHIYFAAKNGDGSDLDVDDTDGSGPETITIRKKKTGQKYIFGVYRFNGTPALGRSLAKVFLYVGSSLLRTYTIPVRTDFDLWAPFEINERGEVVDLNRLSQTRSELMGSAINQVRVGELLAAGNFTVPADVQSENAGENGETRETSQRLNRQGEVAYHAGNLTGAIELYRQALDVNPANAQAWSNIGLAYQKNNQIPEALSANQEAIQRASGATAATVRASSYYNNARIYEASGQWEQALSNFTWALAEKDNAAYTNGIARIKAKLGR